uniref:Uncharacterized protein n=1 Tax=viral metagenome TaxID=1070528 RepID=A0A6C0KFV5_9ZZZZ
MHILIISNSMLLEGIVASILAIFFSYYFVTIKSKSFYFFSIGAAWLITWIFRNITINTYNALVKEDNCFYYDTKTYSIHYKKCNTS